MSLTYLLRNLYAHQDATVRTGHGTMTGSKLGKECVKAVYCHPVYITSMQSASCKMLGWLHKLESRWREKHQQPHICKYSTLMAESEEELKSLLMKAERGEWKS